ncbi:MAG TPA: GNAT family N-acetyltransferase [Vicinamibacterales bacterium]|nr:GNAT family N-acetyltransferase [Vicinamibacterales bacterium]
MTRSSNPDCDVVLRDGTTLRVRPLGPDDAAPLNRFLEALSPDSVYFRFFNPRPAQAAIDRLLSADGDDEFALVAECGGDIVALAQYARITGQPGSAEAAFLVADAMQGRGVGTRLLEQLADHARPRGIETFYAWVMSANHRMLQVFVDSGFTVRSKSDQGVLEVVLSLEQTTTFTSRSAARASVAARASLRPFFEPASVAIVGASRERGSVGAEIVNNLRTTGYRGRIVPVHPVAREIQGLPAFARLTEIPEEIDLAVIVVPAASVLDVARDAAARHVKALVVISAGFSEIGVTGRAREAELLGIVRDAGMRMIGPNCMGLLNADPAVLLNATFSPVFPPAGRVAFSTQSGALGLAILDYARRVNLGISTFASIGNKADVSSNDLIQYWADDPKTAVILLYLESFGNPRKFGQLARAVGRSKPIVAVKAGRSDAGARAASSHTGALASSDTIVSALFHEAGVIRTTTIEEMFDVAMLLDRQPLPGGRRVAILTNAGGPGILAADACEGRGLEVTPLLDQTVAALRVFLPPAAGFQNPVDTLATASAAHYAQSMRLLLADPNVDSLLTIFIPPLVTAAPDVAAAMTDVARTASKPVLATFMGVEGAIPMLAPIPAYRFPEAAISALARVTDHAEWRRRPIGQIPDFATEVAAARAIIEEALAREAGWLGPVDAQRLLDALGVSAVPLRLVRDEDDAVSQAGELGYPVALKAFGPAILHKSDAGAVHLNLQDGHAVRAAYQDLVTRLGSRMSGLLVQPMAGAGVEMFVGGLQDPSFGPVVFCGSGGVLVELFGDAACRLCPLTDREAEDMLNDIRGVARLRGHRGTPPADEAALCDALLRVAALLDASPEIQELDINPLNVLAHGVAALDARIRVAPFAMPPRTRRVRY